MSIYFLTSKLEVDFTIFEVVEKFNYHNLKLINEKTAYITDSFRQFNDTVYLKNIIDTNNVNIQGIPIKTEMYSLTIENKIDTISDSEQYNIKTYEFNEFASISCVMGIKSFIEINFYNSDVGLEDILKTFQLLFEILYVRTYGLLTIEDMKIVVNRFNTILGNFKKRLNPRDTQNIENYDIIDFEDKPISFTRDKIRDVVMTDNYLVTNKLNGIKYFLYIYFIPEENGKYSKNYYLISRKSGSSAVASVWKYHTEITNKNTGDCVCEGEYYNNKFWTFDLLMGDGNILIYKSYRDRLYYLSKLVDGLKNPSIVMKKMYETKNLQNLIMELKQQYGSKWDYENDGFIFNHKNTQYRDKKLKILKWKFHHHQTIDVGVKTTNQTNYYKTLVVGQDSQLTEFTDVLLYSSIPLEDYSIVEIAYDSHKNEFYMTRTRIDKDKPNFITTAQSVWNDIKNPIRLGDISKIILDLKTPQDWIEYRKYSNLKKNELITQNIKKGDIILDIGFGKGGDLLKYKNAGVSKIYAFEPDRENIEEFFRRYNVRVAPARIYRLRVLDIDIILFHESANNIYDNEILRNIKGSEINVVCLFFSLTYFFNEERDYVDLFDSILKLSKPREIIGTVMDGTRAKNLIENYDWKMKDDTRDYNDWIEYKDCGLTIKLIGNNKLYIKLRESETVRGHEEYLVSFVNLLNLMENFNYSHEAKFYDYKSHETSNIVSQFANVNLQFRFSRKMEKSLINMSEIIKYNKKLAIPKDSLYFINCIKNKPSLFMYLPNLDRERISKSADNFYFNNTPISEEKLDYYRYRVLTGIYPRHKLQWIEEQIYSFFDFMNRYSIFDKYRLTNLCFNHFPNHLQHIMGLVSNNINNSSQKTIVNLSATVGEFDIEFSKIFREVVSVNKNVLETTLLKHNTSLYGGKNIRIVENYSPKIDDILFVDFYHYGRDTGIIDSLQYNTMITRIPKSLDYKPSRTHTKYSVDDSYIMIFDKKPTKNAWVFLVMKGDSYIPGAIVGAYSLLLTQTKYDIVCMVTPDVSDMGRKQLSLVFNRVIEVPYIEGLCKPLKTTKQDKMYGLWSNVAFTKWNILSLTDYHKVVFIDADKIVLYNMDHLFEVRAPAGTFSSPFSEKYSDSGKGLYDPYYGLKTGDIVKRKSIEQGLGLEGHNSFVVIGTSLLLEPDRDMYNKYLDFVKKSCSGGFGYSSNSMIDEQSITKFYLDENIEWSMIDQQYNFIPWKHKWLGDEQVPYVYHFFNNKPWDKESPYWIDFEIWWILVLHLLGLNNVEAYRSPLNLKEGDIEILKSVFDNLKLYIYLQPKLVCSYCLESKKFDYNFCKSHRIMNLNGKIECPVLLKKYLN